MIRGKDESGYSGTGEILQGVIFDDGVTVIRWSVPEKPRSIAIFQSFEDFKAVHIESHPTNQTKILFYNGTIGECWTQKPEKKVKA